MFPVLERANTGTEGHRVDREVHLVDQVVGERGSDECPPPRSPGRTERLTAPGGGSIGRDLSVGRKLVSCMVPPTSCAGIDSGAAGWRGRRSGDLQNLAVIVIHNVLVFKRDSSA